MLIQYVNFRFKADQLDSFPIRERILIATNIWLLDACKPPRTHQSTAWENFAIISSLGSFEKEETAVLILHWQPLKGGHI